MGHTIMMETAPSPATRRLLSASEVAQIFGVRKTRVYALLKSGIIPAVHVGRQVRVDKNALDEWIGAGGQALPGGWKR